MAAVALVALLVGGPLGMCLALSYGVVSYMKLKNVDAEYAKRGETPPGYRLIEKWLEGRKARGQAPADAKPARYGMWRYAWQRWQAMWQAQEEKYHAQHEADKKARADARAAGLPKPEGGGWRDRLKKAKAWRWVIDGTTEPKVARNAGPSPDGPAAGKLAEYLPAGDTADPAAGGPRTACEHCGQTLVERDGGWGHPSSNGCPRKPAPVPASVGSDDSPPPGSDRADLAHVSGRRCDNQACGCQPQNQPSTTTEGDSMTTTAQPQQSGEVTGLMSAINYADAVATAHDSHSSGGGEQYRAALANAEVGPETIQSAADAQQATQIAAAAWHNHAAKLREQLAAKEVTTSETGKKDFLLAE